MAGWDKFIHVRELTMSVAIFKPTPPSSPRSSSPLFLSIKYLENLPPRKYVSDSAP